MYIAKGSTAVLPCIVVGDSYDPGADSVAWSKYLHEDDTTGKLVSSASHTKEPFTATGRYKVLYKSGQLDYSLEISEVTLLDNGKYICDAGTKEKTIYLYVVDPVDDVTILGAKDTSQNTSKARNPTTLEYYSDRDGTFECVATGGSPKPTVKVLIDNKELRGDVPGLQYYDYTVKRRSNSFRLEPADDGKTLTCEASVREGVAPTETSVKLHVIGKPNFLPCNNTVVAPLATENLDIKCEFRSRPAFELVTWFAETTGQEIENDSSKDGLEAIVTTKDDHYEAKLRIKVVNKELFQSYKLTVTNSEGKNSITIKVQQGKGPGQVSGAASVHQLMVLVLATVTTAVFFQTRRS
ncbi:hypothetical protein LSAT2_030113 [Lamellibrachia satsuma]|nr:hypothetical protein LSAT2_030113 [Lamellibrachia satsuma]